MNHVYYATQQTFSPGAKTLPSRYFTSPDIYSQELERIFFNHWLCAGRVDQLVAPGDFFLASVGEESLIIVKGQDGEIRAFYNTCRHRGTRLCAQTTGRFPATIQCPYHAWTYTLDGSLIGAPLMDQTRDFDRSANGLYPVALVEWEGFIFINLSGQPQSFETVFAPLIEKFSEWNLPSLKAYRRIDYQVAANWKLIVQNYSECYHCPLVHPDLARKTPYQSGRNDLFEGPFLGGYMNLNHEYGSLTISGKACSAPIGSITRENQQRVYYYYIFPNMLLSLHPDYVMYHTLWPQDQGQTKITCEWLFSSQAVQSVEFNPEDAVEFWDMTNLQDWRVCELSQLGVRSRAYSPSPYSTQESLPAAFDRHLLRVLGHDGL
jgi:Rieske 2Fe-2S family protein